MQRPAMIAVPVAVRVPPHRLELRQARHLDQPIVVGVVIHRPNRRQLIGSDQRRVGRLPHQLQRVPRARNLAAVTPPACVVEPVVLGLRSSVPHEPVIGPDLHRRHARTQPDDRRQLLSDVVRRRVTVDHRVRETRAPTGIQPRELGPEDRVEPHLRHAVGHMHHIAVPIRAELGIERDVRRRRHALDLQMIRAHHKLDHPGLRRRRPSRIGPARRQIQLLADEPPLRLLTRHIRPGRRKTIRRPHSTRRHHHHRPSQQRRNDQQPP